MIIFETDRLIFRCIVREDVEDILKIYNKPENMIYISDGKCSWTDAELTEKYERINQDYNKGIGIGIGIVALELKDTKSIIGEAGLFNSFGNPEKLEMGYIIDSAFWRKGYGLETCKGLMNYAFNKLQTQTLVARMYAENINSVSLSNKCGMREMQEGIAENGKKFLVFEISKKEYNQYISFVQKG